MTDPTSHSKSDKPQGFAPLRWRMVDIITCAVLAVAFGVVFWAWNLMWAFSTPALEAVYPPLKGILYGVWLIPAVLAPLIVRKAGASVFTEGLAASVSLLMGSQWGVLVAVQGVVQGLGGELAFAGGRYRHYNRGIAILAGALAATTATIWDVFAYYSATGLWTFQVPFVLISATSGAIVAGLGSWYLMRALLPTGALNSLAAGAERERI
ncbi:ECF transporter S component [Haloglycomyces albus]|uniref:ECF transporter S component n=1 Tax=Haloglycomyces albus TaxID=526067 RepID=UPI00046CB944|nr:ECF transporter S component [Haloglycomyces albus]